MNLNSRRVWFVGIAIVTLFLFLLLAAPASNKRSSGSTFSRSPDGYGGWYAYMERQGTPVQRWQKPLTDFLQQRGNAKRSATLLRISNQPLDLTPTLEEAQEEWIAKGNTLIMLGVSAPVTEATFQTNHPTPEGTVTIATTRRNTSKDEGLLSDSFGAIVWQQNIKKGQVIFATTPYLAANAYQDLSGNYPFLAKLVTQKDNQIWVDEYLHGYKDAETLAQEGTASWSDYLTKTPILPALTQIVVLLALLVWAQNRRFGLPLTLSPPAVDNSEAYIQALAGVLRKAESSEFVVEMVGKEEQRRIQQALGLGVTPVAPDVLTEAWVRQTGRPAKEIQEFLQPQARKRRLSEPDLLLWLGKIQTLRQHLPF